MPLTDLHETPRRLVPDATIEIILNGVASGMPLQGACETAGLSRATFYRWLAEGDQGLAEAYAQAVSAQVRSRFSKA